jgi:hypothetical protein
MHLSSCQSVLRSFKTHIVYRKEEDELFRRFRLEASRTPSPDIPTKPVGGFNEDPILYLVP